MKKFWSVLILLSVWFTAGEAQCAPMAHKIYLNARFGYSIEYPDIFQTQKSPDNGDGIEFATKDDSCSLAVWGGHNISGSDGHALLEERKESVAHIVPDSERSTAKYYSLRYSDDGGKDGVEHIFHEYVLVNPDMMAGFVFKYPKDEEERFAIPVIDLENSLKMPESGDRVADAPVDVSAFSLKDGKVYKGDSPLECEVVAIDETIEGPLRYWAFLKADASGESDGSVRENEAGVWFFAESGAALTFLPMENRMDCQALIFSPGGERFLVMGGSGMRPDVGYVLYELPEMEKKAEFGGLREEVAWVDPLRFVMTRIDGIREGESFENLSFGLRLSVVLYDSALGETFVLKGATDTENYSLSEVTDDGNAVVIETSATTEGDGEDGSEGREIKVAIPAAG